MSTPKLFITGATGYIGGDVLFVLARAHPDWDIACLVRSAAKGAKITSAYPNVRLVHGDLNSVNLLTQEAKAADMVLQMADSDSPVPAHAIAAGMAAKTTSGFWIHTSGAGILIHPDIDAGTFGAARDRIWDDVADIHSIRAIPAHALHRNVDAIVLAAHAAGNPNVRTAIVCPPTVYGVGRGPDNTNSVQLPVLTRAILQRKRGFVVGEGANVGSNVHVRDLSELYLSLAEAAAGGGGGASWDADGYYFAVAGEHVWRDLSRSITMVAHRLGYLDSADVESVTADEASRIYVYGAMMWGTNSRSRSTRAARDFGWKAVEPKVDDQERLVELVRIEAKALGLN